MKLALDHHYTDAIAEGLVAHGHDVVTAIEAGWASEVDAALLTRCAEERRALVTNDVKDFAPLSGRWLAEGRSHHGLIFTSHCRWPRTRDMIGRYIEALDALLQANPAADAFVDRIQWL